jgi:RNA polymerase sigma factor for flagellar operon FliA
VIGLFRLVLRPSLFLDGLFFYQYEMDGSMNQIKFRGLKFRGKRPVMAKHEGATAKSSVPDNQEKDFGLGNKTPEDLVLEYLPIIRRISAELVLRNPGALDVEDLTSAGVMGLLAAISRFDPSRETKFRTFAEYRIRGAMLDEIRAMDWVPRSVRTRIDKVNSTAAEFIKKTGRPPNQEEMAEALGVSSEEFAGIPVREATVLSLDETVGDEDEYCTLKDVLPAIDQPDPLASCISNQIGDVLMAAINRLSERQRNVVRLYYFSGLTMKAIGAQHGLTESGVCRVHAEALNRLKGELDAMGNELQEQAVS